MIHTGNSVTNHRIPHILDTGSHIAYHTGRQFFTGNELTGTKIAHFHYFKHRTGRHHLDRSAFAHTPLSYTTEHDDALIRIVHRVKDQCL